MDAAFPPARIRLLALDVDGTVTDSRHEVPPTTRLAVERLRAAGVRVLLATGRRYRDTLAIADVLGIDEPLVTASGALVKRRGDHATLHRAAFAPGVLRGALAEIVAAGAEPVVYTDSFAEGFDFHCRSLAAAERSPAGGGFGEYLVRNGQLARVVPDLEESPPADAFAGFAMGPQDAMQALERRLAAAYPGLLSLHTIRSPRYREWLCEIAPAGVTKWSGVSAVAAAAGIGPEAICAVGDDVNDLPMVAAAGLGIAMGNACPPLRAAADRIVAGHDDGGIAEVAEIILAGLAQSAPPAPVGPRPA